MMNLGYIHKLLPKIFFTYQSVSISYRGGYRSVKVGRFLPCFVGNNNLRTILRSKRYISRSYNIHPYCCTERCKLHTGRPKNTQGFSELNPNKIFCKGFLVGKF